MKPTIPKPNSDYRMVEPEELSLIPLSEEDTAKINALKKRINSHKIFFSCFWVFMGSPFLAMNIYTYRIGAYDSESIFILSLFTFVFWFSALLLFLTRIPKDSRCIHAQYGIVIGKWPGPGHSSSRSSNRPYYLDVIFPETNTRYTKAICSEKEYQQVEQGQEVLAFVLDGRQRNRVYAVLLD